MAALGNDNGDDYVSDDRYRIVDSEGKIGYATRNNVVIIQPRFLAIPNMFLTNADLASVYPSRSCLYFGKRLNLSFSYS